ncbi:class I SAM-dependent methyltransferase [Betaproteobacteria bacterium PRO7]|jgi:SAM-dependent methyltransferase|nr:class I SAM-dependent methyltransferase [Betaproteobacteria bacterium PRO7]
MHFDPNFLEQPAADPAPPIVKLSEFLRSPPGRYVLDWEQQQLDAAVADIFGYHALQLGLPEIDALRENRMPLRFCASDRLLAAAARSGGGRVAVINRYEELPFATNSIDLVVMPHILEFAEEPHQVLREVDRVLVPEGQIVLTGFNPVSLWGLRQLMARLGMAPFLPREGQFIALPRIKDWMKLLSFEVSRGRYGCYSPWARSEKWLARWRFMEKAGDRWWPVLGSVYLVSAIKRVRGMRLVGPAWKRQNALRPALAPARPIVTATGEAFSIRVDEPAAPANDAPVRTARR